MYPYRLEGLDPESGQWVLIAKKYGRFTAYAGFSKAVKSGRWKAVRVIVVFRFWRA
ncbi:hypothetical protein ACRYCC_18790 [Actinomadura scrupuli]|uniref:hypothetical protein n=1 Tax=Actinomadura scrupuli TaxID=559629 RepID=UPI003D965EEE